MIERPQQPARCRRCNTAGAFVGRDDEELVLDAPESLFEDWVRHGMRTSRNWRAHT